MGTTATVAVLFCDVVGSTERLTRLGDEAGDDFRRRFFAELRRCVTDTGGIEVKNLGDGLMVVFERSTIDAIRCAGRMHDVATRFDAADPVHLRIGISVGEVANEDADWFGTPVVEAARLCGAAAADQTLAPALLESVVGSRGTAHRFRPLGLIPLKGLAGPLAVVEVDGRAARHPGEVDAPDLGGALSDGVDPTAIGSGRRTARLLAVAVVALAVVVALGVVVALVAGSGDDSGPGSPSRAGASKVDGPSVTAPQGYRPTFDPADCPPPVAAATPGATCGNLVVPESRSRPDGRRLSLPVVKVSGPSPSTADPVIILDVNESVATTSLRDAADVYSLSLRGFGGGSDVPLSCPELQQAWTGTLAVRADDKVAISQRVAAADACAARLRGAGVQLEGYTMVEAANDIRDLALALGLDRVSVAAGGYTTTAAVAFARSNPGAVSSLLLTNPTPPGESTLGDPAAALSRSFARIIGFCGDDSTCRSASPDLQTQYRQRFEQLQAQPVLVSTKSLAGEGPFSVLLDGRRYAAALESAMRESARVGLVPSAVLSAGDELTAAAGIDEDVNFFVREPSSSAAFLSITCSYDARLNRTAEISDATMQQFAGANEPTFGRMCQSWGVPSVYGELSRPLEIDVPVFLASGGLSVSGVNDWAASMAASLPTAVVVQIPTMSEDLVFSPPPCLRNLRRDFVADPTRRMDVGACERTAPRIEFTGPS